MGTPLSELARRLFDDQTFVTVSTVNPDGSPQSSVLWVKRDGDDILFSTVRGRQKARNMERDPRVSVLAFDPTDPYRYVEARGRVTMTDRGGRELIDELSVKYRGQPYPEEPPGTVRVVCRLTPERLVSR
ncbi:MAG TPA: PPOX class F420-dependent oxidoreductase [Pilimelia sp.]|nr:PPOX class F420-dependent oxidoreductase [Pilimelia sp.]